MKILMKQIYILALNVNIHKLNVNKSQILTAHNNTLICRIEEYVIEVTNE